MPKKDKTIYTTKVPLPSHSADTISILPLWKLVTEHYLRNPCLPSRSPVGYIRTELAITHWNPLTFIVYSTQ